MKKEITEKHRQLRSSIKKEDKLRDSKKTSQCTGLGNFATKNYLPEDEARGLKRKDRNLSKCSNCKVNSLSILCAPLSVMGEILTVLAPCLDRQVRRTDTRFGKSTKRFDEKS